MQETLLVDCGTLCALIVAEAHSHSAVYGVVGACCLHCQKFAQPKAWVDTAVARGTGERCRTWYQRVCGVTFTFYTASVGGVLCCAVLCCADCVLGEEQGAP